MLVMIRCIGRGHRSPAAAHRDPRPGARGRARGRDAARRAGRGDRPRRPDEEAEIDTARPRRVRRGDGGRRCTARDGRGWIVCDAARSPATGSRRRSPEPCTASTPTSIAAALSAEPPLSLVRRLARTPAAEQCTTVRDRGRIAYAAARSERRDLIDAPRRPVAAARRCSCRSTRPPRSSTVGFAPSSSRSERGSTSPACESRRSRSRTISPS